MRSLSPFVNDMMSKKGNDKSAKGHKVKKRFVLPVLADPLVGARTWLCTGHDEALHILPLPQRAQELTRSGNEPVKEAVRLRCNSIRVDKLSLAWRNASLLKQVQGGAAYCQSSRNNM
jgi:hypothetical protein